MRKYISRLYRLLFWPVYAFINQKLQNNEVQLRAISQISQQQLVSTYQQEKILEIPPKKLHQIGFKQYSENNEDGVLLYIFSIIGTTNRKCVEIGSGYGNECNSANLIVHHNWHGLLIDSGSVQIKHAQKFFKWALNKEAERPQIAQIHITRDNVNSVIEQAGFSGEIDLLSIDIDGVDYWIWKEIEVCKPRVVVVEIQCIRKSSESVTVPYHDQFEPGFVDGYGIYSGASLAAFNKLAKQKGYRFIGVEQSGYNAFFLRNDVSADYFSEEDITVIDQLPFVVWARKQFYDRIIDKEWINV